MTDVGLVRKGREAADELLVWAFGLDVLKAKKKGITTPQGFDAVVLQTLEAIKGEVAGPQAEAMKAFLGALEQSWPNMSAKQRDKAVKAAAKSWLQISEKNTPPKVGSVLEARGKTIVEQTKQESKKKYNLKVDPSFSLVDETAVTHLANSQVNFVRDMLGKRSDQLSEIARGVVAHGLKQGHDEHVIGAALKEQFSTTSVAGKNDSYWRLLASVFVARARTWSTLSSFRDAGIASFQFEAVIDQVTSNVCRYMHGRVFHVGQAMSKFMDAGFADDPEDVKNIQPWVTTGKTGNPEDPGEQALFFKQHGVKHAIAIIEQSGVGQADAKGKYQSLMSDDKLADSGISTPPLHGHCRSTIIPVFVPGEGLVEAPPEPHETSPFTFPPAPPPPPPVPPGFIDPTATLEFGAKPGPHEEGAMLNGVPLKSAEPGFWEKTPDVDLGETPIVPGKGKKPASGLVIVEPDGRLWLVEPKDHFGGYENTFPKGKLEAGLTAQQNALKEAYEEAGLKAEIVSHIGDFDKNTSTTRYYLAKRTGGAPWDAHFETDKVRLVPFDVAKSKLNVAVDKKVLDAAEAHITAALEGKAPPPPIGVGATKPPKPKKIPKPPPTTAAHAPEPLGDADNILHNKIGEAGGSNPGGMYVGKDGVKRYVKFYDDPAQAASEHLANQIYGDLGLGAPKSTVFMHQGKLAYASEIIEGKTLAAAGVTKENAQKFMQGFGADVLTANWDAVGLSKDNAFVTKGGQVLRIDSGGSFLFRAQKGRRKSDDLLNKITEWDGFFDGGLNSSYKQVAAAAGITSAKDLGAELVSQVEAIKTLRQRSGGWATYVERVVGDTMPAADRKKVVAMLEARTELLDKKLASLKPRERTAGTPAPERPATKPFNLFDKTNPAAVALEAKIRDMVHSSSKLDAYVNEIDEIAGVSSTDRGKIRSFVSSWTSGYKDSSTQQAAYKAVGQIAAGKKPSGSVGEAVAASRETRSERWQAAIGVITGNPNAAAPTHFDLHRGMSGEQFVTEVAKAWADDAVTHVTYPTFHDGKEYPVASWSFSSSKADGFAGSSGVTFRWMHCPIENTHADQVVDDSSFVKTYHHEHECIAGPGHAGGLPLPKQDQRVHYRGKTYTYDDRDELIEKLRDAGKL